MVAISFYFNLLIIFIEKNHLAEDTFTHFKEDLFDKLPLESDEFLTKLKDAELLHSSGSMVRVKDTKGMVVKY